MNTLPEHDRIELALVDKWLSLSGQGCVVCLDGRIVMANSVVGALFGADIAQLLGHSVRNLAQLLDDPLQFHLLAGPQGLDGQIQCRRSTSDGVIHLLIKAHWVEGLLPGSTARYRLLSITDISQVVEAAQDVATQHRRWQSLNAGVVIVSVDEPDLPIVYVNPAFERMTGYSAAECIGRNCRFLQGNLREQSGLQEIRKALIEKRNGYAVLRNFRKDGSEFVNELFISPVHDASTQKLTHFIGVQHLRDDLSAQGAIRS